MVKETIIINDLNIVQNILWDDHDEFKCIDSRYKFHGVDHDCWEFEAIVQRITDNKYFSFRWNDNYSTSFQEVNYGEEFILTEVIPRYQNVIMYD